MKKNLLLCGAIGCGKSTIIRDALGKDAAFAGGYVTLRILEDSQLSGFQLAPASALQDPESLRKGQIFLDFRQGKKENLSVFSEYGTELLTEALAAPFAVADEFGGLELTVPEFREALYKLLKSPVPCIGVIKSQEASEALIHRLCPGEGYSNAYRLLAAWLKQDPDTEIVRTFGRWDESVIQYTEHWVQEYVRK